MERPRLNFLRACTFAVAAVAACDSPDRSARESTPKPKPALGEELRGLSAKADPPAPSAEAEAMPRPPADGKLRIYISADMEGVAGAVTGDQLGPQGFEYGRFREFMTAEVNAAIAGAYEAGAAEVLVSDSHGNGESLLIEKLPPEVQVVRSWPRPLGMMEGIDASFDGAVFIGYHSGTTNPEGVRAHTMSSAKLTDIRLNGKHASEALINAAIAGHFGVPVIFVSCDDACVAETREMLGDVEGAVVKHALGFHSAKTLTPAAAQTLIKAKVKAAVERIGEFRPYVLSKPVTLEVQFKNYRPSEVLAYLPIFERIDAHAVRYQAQDMVDASKALRFLLSYDSTLSP